MTSFEAVVEEEQIEWGKFYPKKVIQIVGVKLSTQISDVNFFIQKSYPKKILSKDLLDLFYITLYTKSNYLITRLILPHFISDNIVK